MQYLMGEENGNTIFKLHSRAFAKFSEYSEYQINLVYIVTLLDSCEKQGDTVLFPKHFNTLLDQVRRCLHQILAKHDMVHAFELMGKIRDLWENGDFTNIVPRIYNRGTGEKKTFEFGAQIWHSNQPKKHRVLNSRFLSFSWRNVQSIVVSESDVESKKCSEDKSSAKSYQQSEQQAYLQKKLYEKEREVNQLGFENSELKKQAQEYELRSQQADYDKAQVIFERNVYKQELEQLRGELERREGRVDRKDRMNDESEPK